MIQHVSQGIGRCCPNIRILIILLEGNEAFVNARVITLALGAVKGLHEIPEAHADPFSRNGRQQHVLGGILGHPPTRCLLLAFLLFPLFFLLLVQFDLGRKEARAISV